MIFTLIFHFSELYQVSLILMYFFHSLKRKPTSCIDSVASKVAGWGERAFWCCPTTHTVWLTDSSHHTRAVIFRLSTHHHGHFISLWYLLYLDMNMALLQYFQLWTTFSDVSSQHLSSTSSNPVPDLTRRNSWAWASCWWPYCCSCSDPNPHT